jgi:phosphoglucosamine mutase
MSNAKQLFGTDGIRGLANHGPLQTDRVHRLGEATAFLLSRQFKRPARIGLGWDTRRSSPALAAALTAGLAGSGADVCSFGEISTPAVSQLTCLYHLDAGIVISASHNPAEDNGIKYFSSTGGKFPDRNERQLEQTLLSAKAIPSRTGIALGRIQDQTASASQDYARLMIRRFSRAGLAGMKVAADLANGATCRTVPSVFQGLGLKPVYLSHQPDGCNINKNCGSLHPAKVGERARRLGLSAGLAFDGDGDRVILTDEKGRVVNGDRMLGILAQAYHRKHRLVHGTVVATVMSNLGLELFLKTKGMHLVRTTVGDRYVAEAMAKGGFVLGGEQSGHILLTQHVPTGDGLLTALEVLAVMQASGRPLSELASGWSDFPQMLVNVPVTRRPDLMQIPGVVQEVRSAEKTLKDRGRVNLRYSGTETLARVMVEAETAGQVEQWAHRIADAVEAAIGNGKQRIVTWLTCA